MFCLIKWNFIRFHFNSNLTLSVELCYPVSMRCILWEVQVVGSHQNAPPREGGKSGIPRLLSGKDRRVSAVFMIAGAATWHCRCRLFLVYRSAIAVCTAAKYNNRLHSRRGTFVVPQLTKQSRRKLGRVCRMEFHKKLKYHSIFIFTRKFLYNMNFNNYLLHLKRLVEAVKHRDISFCYF